MRTVIVLVCLLLSGATLADSVRLLSVPERYWGTWALSTDLCRDDKSVFVVSAKGYVTSQENCTIQWLTETAGAEGPIYSAHMRCSNSGHLSRRQKRTASSCRTTAGSFRQARISGNSKSIDAVHRTSILCAPRSVHGSGLSR